MLIIFTSSYNHRYSCKQLVKWSEVQVGTEHHIQNSVPFHACFTSIRTGGEGENSLRDNRKGQH